LPRAEVTGETPVIEALVATGLVSGTSEARRAIGQGGVYLNNVKVADPDATVGTDLLAGGFAVLRRGKKTLAGLAVSG
jgi:tyrosyl-tRNA synthetase